MRDLDAKNDDWRGLKPGDAVKYNEREWTVRSADVSATGGPSELLARINLETDIYETAFVRRWPGFNLTAEDMKNALVYIA